MKLGISVASRGGFSAASIAEYAVAAETAGLSSFFVAERVADSLALAQAALAATSRITVGTAVANAVPRHPAYTAMTASTLAELSGGRFVLGLGVANPALNESVLGLPAAPPVAFMRTYVGTLRSVLPADRATVPVPLWLAALQPRMLRLASEVADGVLLNLTTPATLPGALAAVRPRPGFTVACVMPCAVGASPSVARRTGQELVVGYALHPAASRLFAASGYAAELAEAARLLRDGDRDAALRLVSDEMVADFLLHGDHATVAAALARYREAGVDLPILFPVAGEGGWPDAVRRTLDFAAVLVKEA